MKNLYEKPQVELVEFKIDEKLMTIDDSLGDLSSGVGSGSGSGSGWEDE